MNTSGFIRQHVTTTPAVARLHLYRAIVLGLALSATAGFLSGCGSAEAELDPRSRDQLIQLATVESADAVTQSFTGIVSARVQSNLGFRVAGKIVERLVDTGQAIHQGQVLMRLDTTDYAHAITAKTGTVEAARAHLIQAAADEERYRRLVDAGAVSRSDYDRTKAQADSARALLSAAEAELKVARDEGNYGNLVADADGIVLETTAEPGQYVSAGQVVIRVARAGSREATVNLPETLRPTIGSTASVTLYGQNGAGKGYSAHLRQLSDAADPVTRTFEARYVLEGDAARTPLGTTVTVKLLDSAATELAVPLAAVNDEGQGSGVWVYDHSHSTVSFRPVHVSRFTAEQAIVGGELKVGDSVVALGGHLLHSEQHVRIDPSLASN